MLHNLHRHLACGDAIGYVLISETELVLMRAARLIFRPGFFFFGW
jgi:hypothetical protein